MSNESPRANATLQRRGSETDIGLCLDHPITAAARGRGVMGLVQNQKASRQERTQPLTQRVRVGWVDQEVVRYEEAAVRAPRIYAEAALAPHPRSSNSNTRPKRSSSSSFHCSRTEGGVATTMVLAFLRRRSSRAMRPASIVLPRPVSSAMKRLTRLGEALCGAVPSGRHQS